MDLWIIIRKIYQILSANFVDNYAAVSVYKWGVSAFCGYFYGYATFFYGFVDKFVDIFVDALNCRLARNEAVLACYFVVDLMVYVV